MNIIGNNNAVKLLERTVNGEKVGQACIFSGPENVGKFSLAKNFAKRIISGKDINLTSLFNKVKEDVFPDLIILQPEIEEKKGITRKLDIKIARVRESQKDLSLFPYQGKYRVLIINDAHRMTEESQNALLKTLEEPNPTSVMILITHEEGKILPTIKSRCQKIRFGLVLDEEIKKELKVSDEIINLSLGRPGLAVGMNDNNDELELRRDALNKLKSLPQAGINQRLKIAEELSINISETVKKMELWIWILHTSALKDTRLFKIIERIDTSLDEIKNTNANTRLVLENLLLNL